MEQMTISHNSLKRAELRSGVSGMRVISGAILLALAVAAVFVAGGWGVISSLTTGAPPANIGESVEVSGGLMRVDSVEPEHMASMQSKKFSASGMNMSSMGVDMVPDGYRRFTVDVSLVAQSQSISYAPEDFQVSAEGVKPSGPIRAQLEKGTIEAGEAVSGSLVFQVPDKAPGLKLDFDGGRSVALDLPKSEQGGHGH